MELSSEDTESVAAAPCGAMKRLATITTIRTATAPMSTRSSFLAVSAVMLASCETATVRFRPSGVISYTHAKTTARGKPIRSKHMTTASNQLGSPSALSMSDAACASSQPATP